MTKEVGFQGLWSIWVNLHALTLRLGVFGMVCSRLRIWALLSFLWNLINKGMESSHPFYSLIERAPEVFSTSFLKT